MTLPDDLIQRVAEALAVFYNETVESHERDAQLAVAAVLRALPELAVAAENERLRGALNDIVHASSDEGLAAMCNWMRGRALAALVGERDERSEL